MKVLILGSSGIIGQSLRERVPGAVSATFHLGRTQCDLGDPQRATDLLLSVLPDVVVNLAGESNTDTVERDPEATEWINAGFPEWLANWCHLHKSRLIQISTQAVFSGKRPPYRTDQVPFPVNSYGRQKKRAEDAVMMSSAVWKIIRPTFVLGVRPDPSTGRENPIESMLRGQRKQVDDRWFSPSFAPDVARVIWHQVIQPDKRRIIHAGIPMRASRFAIAKALGVDFEAVSHDDFPGIAPRPRDTTYAEADHFMSFSEGIKDCLRRWKAREAVAA
jgi:dTDP-4-dehydrorhamnose reductase